MKKILLCMLGTTAVWLLLASITVSAQTRIFKWVDENGVTHYTAEPPEEASYAELGINMLESRVVSSAADEEAASENGEPAGDTLDTEAAAAMEAHEALVSARCEEARNNLEALKSQTAILVTEDSGKQRLIRQDERPQMIQEQEDFLDEWCR